MVFILHQFIIIQVMNIEKQEGCLKISPDWQSTEARAKLTNSYCISNVSSVMMRCAKFANLLKRSQKEIKVAIVRSVVDRTEPNTESFRHYSVFGSVRFGSVFSGNTEPNHQWP